MGGVADGHGGRTGHAAFAGATEGRLDEAGGRIADVRIGHDENEIFRAAGGLDAFAVGGAGFVNVFRDRRRADEGDGFDQGVPEDGVDGFASAMDEIEHTGRKSGFFRELRDADRGERDFFAGFEDEGISAGDGHGPHPERDHGGEIEWRDAGRHAERLADGVTIDATGHVFERLAHEERGGAAGEFDVFQSAADIATRLGQRFAVLAGHALGQFLKVVFEQDLKLHQNPGSFDRRGFHPLGERVRGGADRLVDDIGAAERSFGDDFTDRGVVNRGGGDAGDVRPFSADEQRNGEDFAHN